LLTAFLISTYKSTYKVWIRASEFCVKNWLC
jgi:hypothetical protein